jgi:hypothetical protein
MWLSHVRAAKLTTCPIRSLGRRSSSGDSVDRAPLGEARAVRSLLAKGGAAGSRTAGSATTAHPTTVTARGRRSGLEGSKLSCRLSAMAEDPLSYDQVSGLPTHGAALSRHPARRCRPNTPPDTTPQVPQRESHQSECARPSWSSASEIYSAKRIHGSVDPSSHRVQSVHRHSPRYISTNPTTPGAELRIGMQPVRRAGHSGVERGLEKEHAGKAPSVPSDHRIGRRSIEAPAVHRSRAHRRAVVPLREA